MPFNINDALDLHANALQLRSMRTQVLASNMANADTPNYKARDIDFRAALDKVQNNESQLKTTHKDHIGPASVSSNAELLFRIPLQPSVDGNTVDTQLEQAEFSKNAVQHEAAFTLLNGRIKSLLTAIRGE